MKILQTLPAKLPPITACAAATQSMPRLFCALERSWSHWTKSNWIDYPRFYLFVRHKRYTVSPYNWCLGAYPSDSGIAILFVPLSNIQRRARRHRSLRGFGRCGSPHPDPLAACSLERLCAAHRSGDAEGSRRSIGQGRPGLHLRTHADGRIGGGCAGKHWDQLEPDPHRTVWSNRRLRWKRRQISTVN